MSKSLVRGSKVKSKLVTSVAAAVIGMFSLTTQANVVGSDAQNFNPTTSGLDFVTVHSSETLEPGIINLGFFMNHAINTLPFFENLSNSGSSQGKADFNDTFTAADFNMGIGLTSFWDIGVSFQFLLASEVDNTNGLGIYEDGIMDIRFNSKLRLLGDNSEGLAVIVSSNLNQIENNPFAGEGAGPTFNVELAGDTTWRKWAFGANLGYRFRDGGTPIAGIQLEPMPDQFLASVAASYLFTSLDTKLILEIYNAWPVNAGGVQNFTDRELSSSEFLLGLKHDLNRNLALHFGGATELIQGASSPDWRIYAGVNWTAGPICDCPEQAPQIIEVEKIVEVPGEPPKTEEYESIVLPGFFFKTATAQFQKRSEKTMRVLISTLRALKGIDRIIVEGHTDSIGTDAVNDELSQYRADVIKGYILSNMPELTDSQIEAIGYGENRPIADNGNYQGRAKNRRVELKVFRSK